MDAQCANCHAPASVKHHVVPRSVGGNDRKTNLVLLCGKCHKTVHKYRRTLSAEGKLRSLEQMQHEVQGRADTAEWICQKQEEVISARDAEVAELYQRLREQNLEMRRLAAVETEFLELRDRVHRYQRGQEPILVGGASLTRHEVETDFLVAGSDGRIIASIPGDAAEV